MGRQWPIDNAITITTRNNKGFTSFVFQTTLCQQNMLLRLEPIFLPLFYVLGMLAQVAYNFAQQFYDQFVEEIPSTPFSCIQFNFNNSNNYYKFFLNLASNTLDINIQGKSEGEAL